MLFMWYSHGRGSGERKRRCPVSLNTLPNLCRVTMAVYTERIG